jgi:hypothetical protein
MGIKKIRFLLALSVVGIIGMLTVVVMNHTKAPTEAPQSKRPKLPDDVERLIDKYTYRENDRGLDIQISGNRIVYRGKKMFGLRSNVVKATYFETIRGVLQSEKGRVEFSASEADWELSPTSPLDLNKDVSITFNNRKINEIKRARIYFRQGVLEVTGNRKEVYHFR